jgi:hypothetical protein
MNTLCIIGIVLGAAVIVTDRYFYKLPNWLAIVLFTAAWVLIIAGMLMSRNAR